MAVVATAGVVVAEIVDTVVQAMVAVAYYSPK
jgi:hypothetical protein